MRQGLVLSIALVTTLIAVRPVSAQISDQRLGEKVLESVHRYSRYSIFDDVNIYIENRNVVLTGKVTVPLKKDDIGKRVSQIDGVRSLRNDIEVLPVSQQDATLRSLAANRIYNYPAFWRYAQLADPPIHIIVEHSRITLTGAVESQVDKMLAQSLLDFSGVFSVENKLRVAP